MVDRSHRPARREARSGGLRVSSKQAGISQPAFRTPLPMPRLNSEVSLQEHVGYRGGDDPHKHEAEQAYLRSRSARSKSRIRSAESSRPTETRSVSSDNPALSKPKPL